MFGARPTYFVTRPDGTRTALVEVDQLPASIKIAGIPANLPAIDAYDMTWVGNRERSPFQYIIETVAAAAAAAAAAANNNPPTSASTNNPNSAAGLKERPLQLSSGNGEVDRKPRNGFGKNKEAQVSSE